MKKKILAVLLTLCLVLGLLPLSALAETWSVKLDDKTTVEVKKDGTGYKVTGNDADKYTYYSFTKDSDGKFYYTYTDPEANDSTKYGPFGDFTLVSFDVTLDLNADDADLPAGSTSSVTTDKDGKITLPTPIRGGYTFDGWYTEKTNGTTKYESGKEVQLEKKDQTLFAYWTENKNAVTVTFDPSNGDDKIEVQTNEDKTVTPPTDPEYDGHVFLGWYTEDGKEVTDFTKMFFEEDTTLTAYWGFEITFVVNDGSEEETEPYATKNTDKDGVLTELPDDPTRDDGYDFDSWNTVAIPTEEDPGETVEAGHKFEKATTVYAQWIGVTEDTAEAEITEDEDGNKEAETTFETISEEDGATLKNSIIEKKGGKFTLRAEQKDEDSSVTTAEIKKEKVSITSNYLTRLLQIIKEAIESEEEQGNTIEVETIEIEGLTGSVDLPFDIVEGLGDEDVEFDIEQTNDGDTYEAAAEEAVGKIKNDNMKARKPADGAKLHTVEVDLTKGTDKTPVLNGGKDVMVSVYLDVESKKDTVKPEDLALFWLKSATSVEKYNVEKYANKVISWKTNHLSEWGAIELAEEEVDDTGNNGGGGNNRPSGGGGGGSASSGYSVSVSKTTNGKVSVSPSRAEEGDTVTITVTPDKGYELDKLTVKDADGNTIRTTNEGDGKYTFIMPDGKVTIEVTFKAIEEDTAPAPATPSFSDVPSSFWAYQQITWVAEQGIMNGYANGTFAPDNNTTRQALWMVLGRLSGELNADSTMAQAREWAIANNVSDGTNPGNAMSRQQMVTMLYRYAQMKGYATNGSTDLSTYPDAAGVASYAQDALSWAVANGVVTGTTDGRLNPEGTASRAHFAVFMYRFCGLYADEA